jgi:hypothetical protein
MLKENVERNKRRPGQKVEDKKNDVWDKKSKSKKTSIEKNVEC